jgi:DNA-binding GntR family transcriptional regulator
MHNPGGDMSATANGPMTVVTIADRVFELIQRSITEGEIRQGSKISEPELARRYGISRGPLREAISRLEACGLVERKPNIGARVISLSSEQLMEIYHVREALEGMAARLAAQNMANSEIRELRSLLLQHAEEIARDSSLAYFQKEADLDFHYRIVKGSKNKRLINLLCDDLYHLVRLYRLQFALSSKRGPQALKEHEHIVDAIERRDGELAEILMRHHIRASRENVERLLSEQSKVDGKDD